MWEGRSADIRGGAGGVNLGLRRQQLKVVWNRLVAMIAALIQRRRQHWIEISVERAWSRDLPPRLFDLE